MARLIHKRTGQLMLGAGVVGIPVSLCAYFAWPMLLLGGMLSFDLEPSGEWDALTIGANIANLVVYVGATVCLFVSPALVAAGVAVWALAEKNAKDAAKAGASEASGDGPGV